MKTKRIRVEIREDDHDLALVVAGSEYRTVQSLASHALAQYVRRWVVENEDAVGMWVQEQSENTQDESDEEPSDDGEELEL